MQYQDRGYPPQYHHQAQQGRYVEEQEGCYEDASPTAAWEVIEDEIQPASR